jgi:hypothetical protein
MRRHLNDAVRHWREITAALDQLGDLLADDEP